MKKQFAVLEEDIPIRVWVLIAAVSVFISQPRALGFISNRGVGFRFVAFVTPKSPARRQLLHSLPRLLILLDPQH